MLQNKNSAAIIDYLRRIAPQFIKPLDDALIFLREQGQDIESDSGRILAGSFHLLAMQLANADRYVSVDEVAFILDIMQLFDSSGNNNPIDPRKFRSKVEEIINEDTMYREVDIPVAIKFLDVADTIHGTNYGEQARAMFMRFATAVVKADDKVTAKEQKALERLKELLYAPEPIDPLLVPVKEGPTPVNESVSVTEDVRPLDELLDELNKLVGLENVKKDVLELVNFLKVQQLRQSKGLAITPISRHLVFYGNPGTGKTTVARLLAQIYRALTFLSKGHLVETHRSGLVAGYMGQTALKVQEVVNRARGGVLFIDEAYALTTDSEQDYGREAIDTLIKFMEDYRDDLIVIVAGYTDKMEQFLQSNPGLRSRFNKYLFFEDYSSADLVDIFAAFCNKSDFQLSPKARQKITTIFQTLYSYRDETFGNARLARNAFEKTVNNQANRIVSLISVDEEILSTIEPEDIPGEVEFSPNLRNQVQKNAQSVTEPQSHFTAFKKQLNELCQLLGYSLQGEKPRGSNITDFAIRIGSGDRLIVRFYDQIMVDDTLISNFLQAFSTGQFRGAMLITSGFFTEDAQKLVQGKPLRLFDIAAFGNYLNQARERVKKGQ